MKNVSLLSLSVVLATAVMAAPASAADLAARPYTKAPPVIATVYDWSGFYIGGNAGYGTTRNCWDFVSLGGAPLAGNQGCYDADGAVAGGQIGYRWQSNAFVFGLEAQGNWADLDGGRVSLTPGGGAVSINSRVEAFGLFTGQIGYAWNNVLLYAKGGAALVDNRYSHTFTGTNVLFNSTSDTRWGATVGAGVEFGFSPNWSFGVEYNHIFLDRDTLAFAAAPAGVASTNSIGQDVDLVTARINYRFGGSGKSRY
jgi:outer membrane immunogenic protein